MSGNAKDVCQAEAKAARTKTVAEAEMTYKGTPKAHESAMKDVAKADYNVAKERCDDKAGNDKDVCVKEAKAALTKAEADAKMQNKVSDARSSATDDKMDANYKVAAAKCDAMAGTAKDSCMDQAKAAYKK
jgi:hypothetical protein